MRSKVSSWHIATNSVLLIGRESERESERERERERERETDKRLVYITTTRSRNLVIHFRIFHCLA